MLLMGTAAFETGVPSAPVVSLFGAAPLPLNYDVIGAERIQKIADVAGTLAKYVTTPAADNAEIRGAVVGAADMLAADAALGGFVVPTWGAAGGDNERSVVLTYDGGAAPAGFASVVRGVWKGTDLLIFLTFTPPPLFVFNGVDLTQFVVRIDTEVPATVSGGLIRKDAGSPTTGEFTAWIDPTLAPALDFAIDFTWRSTATGAIFYLMFLGENNTDVKASVGGDKYVIKAQGADYRLYEYRAGAWAYITSFGTPLFDVDVEMRVEITDLGAGGKRLVVIEDPYGTPVEILDRTEATPPPDLGNNIGLWLTAGTVPNYVALAIDTVENT